MDYERQLEKVRHKWWLDVDGNIIKSSNSLRALKDFTSKKWPGCEFDGDVNRGATTIYVMDQNEEPLGEIHAPEEDDEEDEN